MPHMPTASEKARKQRTLSSPQVFEIVWSLGGVRGELKGSLDLSKSCLGASWRCVGGYLEPSRATLSHLGGHLG
eukprot:9181399-Pyramimonas_sp.AAC.2